MNKYITTTTLILLSYNLLNAQSLDSLIPKKAPGIYSVLLSKNNKTIYQQYFNGQSKTTLFNEQSVTKSITSLLIGITIDKGYIKSVDQKIADFFPELKNDPDKRKMQITLRQVMNQASGLYHEDLPKLGEWLQIPNPSAYVIKAPLNAQPGKVFHYSNAASHLLSVIVTKSTRMTTRAFAQKYLFGPLNITGCDWMKMRDGYYDGSGLLSIRLHAADVLKIGELVLNNGRYGKTQIVSAAWINTTLKPTITYNTDWGFEKSTYALCWYHYSYKGTPLTYAMGWGGQFLVIIPSLNSTIVVNQAVDDNKAIQQANNFMYKVFPLVFERLLQPKN